MRQPGKRDRILLAATIVAALVLGAYLAIPGLSPDEGAGAAQGGSQIAVNGAAVRAQQLPGGVLVRGLDPRAPFGDGRVYVVSPAGRADRAGALACKQLHAAPGGTGLCLGLAENGLDYDAILFDGDYRETRRFPIAGVPDRARVSPDGRYAAYTTFDDKSAQGYFASASEFTTFTRILDTRTGKVVLRLEDLTVIHEGRPLPDTSDENFWGVTFTGDGRYYATGALLGEHYLLEGRIGSRQARTIRAHVECPSLSPDGSRIAYKRRIGNSNRWRLHVLDLASGEDVALAERRSIDDQPEWLDDERIAYSDDRSVFAVPADGGGRPVKLVGGASSPASPAARDGS
jgi:WD40-like Beta Propeller Repeat